MARRLCTVLARVSMQLQPVTGHVTMRTSSHSAVYFKPSKWLPPLSTTEGSASRSRHLTTETKKRKTVNITMIDRDGDKLTVPAKIGDTLLEVAKEFDIDVEGACEGTLSCSTCHLIVKPDWYKKILDPLTEEEQDMLDLAYGLTDTSRLGCQIMVSKELDGLVVTVPSATKDIRAT